MKKILFILLCLSSLTAYGQRWDELKNYKLKNYNGDFAYIQQDKFTYYGTTNTSGIVNQHRIPAALWVDYTYGKRCYNAGAAFITIGCLSTVAGAILYFCGDNTPDQLATKITLGAGSGLIAISIPLVCVGSTTKRNCNRDFKTIYYLQKSQTAWK